MPYDPAYADAISSVESGGRYDILGPVTGSGDRAYGKYQVMGANIPQWTREHLGREMTPQEFLADKAAQDAVFQGQFGKYVEKYGNPQDAASAWFTGRPLSEGANRRDILGTTGSGYVAKFNAALGQPQAQAPVPAFNSIPQQTTALPAFDWSPQEPQQPQQQPQQQRQQQPQQQLQLSGAQLGPDMFSPSPLPQIQQQRRRAPRRG